MSAEGEAVTQRKSVLADISKEGGETNKYKVSYNRSHEETQPVKLTDIFGEAKSDKLVTGPLPQKPVPKRKHIPALYSDSEPARDRHMKSRGESFPDEQHLRSTSSPKQRQGDLEVGDRWTNPFLAAPLSLLNQQQLPQEGGVVISVNCGVRALHLFDSADHDSDHQQQNPLRKEKYVDSSLWHKLLHPEQRNIKRCRPSENRFDAFEGECHSHDAENRNIQAVEEGIGPLHITEERPVRAEIVDEQIKNVELRVKKRVDSVGTDCLKDIERQLEIIEQGELANLHLDPADEDPAFAAVIPRPDVYAAEVGHTGGAAFHRGEPVRSSAGGVIETSGKSWSRPRTHSDNAGLLSTDINEPTPSRHGFGRTPVRRHYKSPTSSPVPRRIPLSDDVVRAAKRNNVSYEVCIA
jgi:hypothetical protein